MSISHGVKFGYHFRETFAVLFVFFWRAYLIAPALRESFAGFIADGSVLCHLCNSAFIGFVAYRRYSVECTDVFRSVATL